jgi:hypothetical protein
MVDPKKKRLYLYLDNESMTGYVGETNNLKRRHMDHKGDIWPGRRELVSKIGEPVVIKADFNNMKAVWFAEHAVYEKYKAEGYDMLQKPPHPNVFKKYHDRVNSCQICDELGCDFSKERLDYILAVHRVSKLCECCQEVFYYDPVKHGTENKFNDRIYCSKSCALKITIKNNTGKKQSEESNKKKSEAFKGEKNPMYGKHHAEESNEKNRISHKGKKRSIESRKKQSETIKGEGNPMFGVEPWNKGLECPEISERTKGENNPAAILTVKKVRMIKVMLRSDIKTVKQIAKLFNVRPGTIYSIKYGNSWPDV